MSGSSQRGSQLKRTMIKDRVGAVRTSAYDLPDQRHEYGLKCERDRENAGAVMSSWDVGVRSSKAQPNRSFVRTNKAAILAGNLTAKDCRKFAQSHKDIVAKQVVKRPRGVTIPENATFGRPTEESNSTISELVQAKLTTYGNENSDYPDMSGLKKKGKLPKPRDTRCSRGMDVRTKGCSNDLKEPVQEKTWKMKKFQGIGSVTSTQPVFQQTPKNQTSENGANENGATE